MHAVRWIVMLTIFGITVCGFLSGCTSSSPKSDDSLAESKSAAASEKWPENEPSVDWNPYVKEEISAFISDNHDFYNETLGWGRYKNVDWNQQKKQAEQVISEIESLRPGVEDYIETLKNEDLITDGDIPPEDPRGLLKDFDELKKTLNRALEKKNVDRLIKVHRIFHSLDMAFNGYKSSDDWNASFYETGS